MITRKNKKNALAEAVNVENMTDEEFNGYIKNVENGKVENTPFRTFETEDEYQSEIDKLLGMNLRQANAELENFNKIKEMAMVLFDTENPDEAMENFRKCLMRVNSKEINDKFLNAGFNVIMRDVERTIEETLELVEKAFGLK